MYIYFNFILKTQMFKIVKNIKFVLIVIISLSLTSCAKEGFFKPGNAREISPDPRERVKKNLEEGKGFRINDAIKGGRGATNFEFASSNELWRASLDTLDFMPLALANYSGGVIVTDWYSDSDENNESVKISIRFVSNEVRSDALIVKVFYKNCSVQQTCKISDRSGALSDELTKKILSKAALYEQENKSKKKK